MGGPDWDFVSINAGYGVPGFFFNETGLQYDQDDGFAGWLGKQLDIVNPLPCLGSPCF